MKNNCGIYAIINIANDMIYVGSSKQINVRKNQHFSMLKNNKHYNKKLQNAWNNYGEDNFVFKILENVETIEHLSVIEQKYLNLFESYKREKGYNICQIAESCAGRQHTEETKEKIRICKIGSKNGMYGKKTSANTKLLLSIAHTGSNNYFFGKHHTEETRQKISEVHKGKPKNWSKQHREKIRVNQTNTKRNNSKLNMDIVREIRQKYNNNDITYKQLADLYNLKVGHIQKIITNKIWKEND